MIYRFLCNKRVNTILLSFLILLVYSSVCSQVLIDNTSFVIGNGVNITINSDLEVSESVHWQNNGIISIIPIRFSNIIFDAVEDNESTGKFIFTGDGDIFLSSQNSFIHLQNIQVERDIDVDNNLNVGKSLVLLNGVISLNNYSVLSILNESESSLIHDSDNTYIEGKLKRKVYKNGGVYEFPIGSSYGYHNVKISNISSKGEVSVLYDESIVLAENLLNKNTEIAIKGFWQIRTIEDSFSGNIKFSADFDVSAFNLKTRETSINELISKDYQDASDRWGIVPTNCDNIHLSSLIDVGQADYCVIKRKESEFINTLIVNGINESRFIIPVIKGIKNGELSIVNNHGKVIFHSYNYQNDFDGASVHPGTYYYRFTYLDELSGKRKQKKGFIEVFYEK